MVDFLVIGPFGSVVYANVFPLIKDQFEVLDARNYRKDDKFKDMNVQTLSGSGGEMSAVEGYKKYDRILIKKK